MGKFEKKIFNMSVNNCKVKMHVDTVADSAAILSKKRTEFGKPHLDSKKRHLDVYDSHQLTLMISLICQVGWKGSTRTHKQLEVVQSDKGFGQLGKDLLPNHGLDSITNKHLPYAKSYNAHARLIPGS